MKLPRVGDPHLLNALGPAYFAAGALVAGYVVGPLIAHVLDRILNVIDDNLADIGD